MSFAYGVIMYLKMFFILVCYMQDYIALMLNSPFVEYIWRMLYFTVSYMTHAVLYAV